MKLKNIDEFILESKETISDTTVKIKDKIVKYASKKSTGEAVEILGKIKGNENRVMILTKLKTKPYSIDLKSLEKFH